jgi:Predicted phosphotransferase related to Ser/Thr protein kinases
MELQTSPQGDTRLMALRAWLSTLPSELGIAFDSLRPASSDASFRRYFRVDLAQGTAIVMDAPPSHEDCRPFIHIGQRLGEVGLRVPELLSQDIAQGFLLLSDLGTHTFYQRLHEGVDDATLQTLYRPALTALVSMQQARHDDLPSYDRKRLAEELEVFRSWYVEKHCATTLSPQELTGLEQVFNTLVEDSAAQPTVLVHRDYHSPNLMVPQGEDRRPGIIDFQDALAGPITYDIASLVTDARYTWEEEQQLDWAIRYWEAARAAGLPVGNDFAAFHRAYEWMSLQRNLRILGVFVRLSVRDGKHHYLDHLPRVKGYVRQVAVRYGAFKPLIRLLDRLDGVEPNPVLVPR